MGSPLRTALSNVFRDTTVYGLISIFSKSITLFTLPLLTLHFSVEEYGLFDTYYLSLTILITIFLLGQDSAVFRYFYDEDNKGKGELITHSLAFTVFVSLGVCLVFFLASEQISFYFFKDKNYLDVFKILMWIVPFGIIYSISEAILRLTSNLKKYLFLTLTFIFLNFFIIVLSTKFLDASIGLFFKLLLVVWSVSGLLGLFLIKEWLVFPRNLLISRKVLLYGIPMGIVVFIETFQPILERIVIINYLDYESLGIYAVSTKIVMTVSLLVGAFQMGFMPIVMKTYKDEDAIDLYNLSLIFYVTLLTISLILLCAYAEHIIFLLAGEGYLESSLIIFPLATAIYFQAIGSILGIGTVIVQKTYLRLLIHIFCQIITLLMMIFLSYNLGLVGIAIGVMVGKLILLLLYACVGQYLYPYDWNYGALFMIMPFGLLFSFGISNLQIYGFAYSMVVIFMVVIIACIGYFQSGGYRVLFTK